MAVDTANNATGKGEPSLANNDYPHAELNLSIKAMCRLTSDFRVTPPGRCGRIRQHGFTLLEMLTVIGVILVLVAIAAIAYSRLDNGTKATKVALENCRAMLTEYEAAGGDITVLVKQPVTNPLTINPGNVNVGQNGRQTALEEGHFCFRMLLRTPVNKTAMSKLPNKQQLPDPFDTTQTLPADSWQNPIIYVDPTGLSGVNVGYDASNAARPYINPNMLIRSRDGRPFFASAGPDGDFSTGDDNVYSFEN